MSLAQSVLEYFLRNVRSFTFFATHYHELTELAHGWRELVSAHMAIKEHKGELVFLRKLKLGPANRSYGIEVARKAGLPVEVTERAQEILVGLAAKGRELERKQLSLLDHTSTAAPVIEPARSDFVDEKNQQIVAKLELLDGLVKKFNELQIDNLTPLEALNQLSQFKKSMTNDNLL